MEQAIQKFLENAGMLGPIIIFLGWYIWMKDKQIQALYDNMNKVQESRTKDAQQVVDELMELNDKWTITLSANTTALHEMKMLLTMMREERLRATKAPPPGSG